MTVGKFINGVLEFVAGIVLWIYTGFILSHMWAWFVMPIFDAPVLTAWYACGLILMWSVFRNNSRLTIRSIIHMGDRTEIEEWVEIILAFVAYSTLFLMGWCLKGVM